MSSFAVVCGYAVYKYIITDVGYLPTHQSHSVTTAAPWTYQDTVTHGTSCTFTILTMSHHNISSSKVHVLVFL